MKLTTRLLHRALCGLLAGCALPPALAQASPASAWPAEAQPLSRQRMLDVEGRAVQIAELGPEAGAAPPTVVFIAGLGEDLGTWRLVQPRVALVARTLSYDRGGLGGSAPRPGPRDLGAWVAELEQVLRASGHAPPYVLVGHSLGGTLAVAYARGHPADVAGLVLVDPEDQRLLDALKAQLPAELWAAREAALAKALPAMPPAVQAEMAGLASTRAVADAYRSTLPALLFTGTLKNPRFPGNPLEQDLKLALHQADLAGMPKAEHVLVPGSRHYIQADAPELLATRIAVLVQRLRGEGAVAAGQRPRP